MSRIAAGALAIVVILVAAVVALGLVLRSQHDDLADARKSVTELQGVQRSARRDLRALARQLDAQRQRVAGLSAALQSAQQRLQRDEQRLNLTEQRLPPDQTKLAANVSPSVVIVGCAEGFGSGFALDLPPTGGNATVVVTAAHVVSDCRRPPASRTLTVTQAGRPLDATLRAVDTSRDVALLDVRERLPALQPGDPPIKGEFVMAVGTPLSQDFEGAVSSGTISLVEAGQFLHSAPTSNGNSGGPLVDRTGRAVGVVSRSFVASSSAPVVENANTGVRLNALCGQILHGSVCSRLP